MNYTELLGYLAAGCTTIAFLPQAIKAWKNKSARDLSLPTFLLLCIGLAAWMVYGILLSNTPIILANSITLALASTILYFKVKFG
ncbi:MAG: SemiSWEET transporter [Cyclobacteriaceae bacterium]|nr:SemiSWEET transporter [Cyclobacteriaceae bacterium]